jgi:tetratricopeptide (TPR) repeat protein
MRARLVWVLAAVLLLASCHKRQVTKLERDEAAIDVSDADFAVTIHDWARAESMYGKAAELSPDQGDIWMNLGIARMRLHNSSGAKEAFKSALSAYKDTLASDETNSVIVLRTAYVLVVLGRFDEAHALIDHSVEKNPDDPRLKGFVQGKGLDRMQADPALKAISP